MLSENTRSKAAVGFAEAIEAMATRLQQDLRQVLIEVAEGAVRAVPGAVGAVITERGVDGPLVARAGYGRVPENFITVQNELGEGPALDAAAGTGLQVIADAGTDSRWPRFAGQAADMGIRGLLCAPLALGGRSVGALSLLSADIDPFDDESEDMAVIFAAHAAITVAGAHRETHLGVALDSRGTIGQAKGVLMERFSLSDPVAFAVLVRVSKEINQKLLVVARHLCETGDLLGSPHRPV